MSNQLFGSGTLPSVMTLLMEREYLDLFFQVPDFVDCILYWSEVTSVIWNYLPRHKTTAPIKGIAKISKYYVRALQVSSRLRWYTSAIPSITRQNSSLSVNSAGHSTSCVIISAKSCMLPLRTSPFVSAVTPELPWVHGSSICEDPLFWLLVRLCVRRCNICLSAWMIFVSVCSLLTCLHSWVSVVFLHDVCYVVL